MIKYSFLLLLIIGAISLNTFAQETFQVCVKDSLTNQPIAFVSVSLRDDSGKVLASIITDSAGIFSSESKGTIGLTLYLSHVSYIKKALKINSATSIPSIIWLKPTYKEIDEIVIQSTIKRVETKFDKTIYRIDETAISASITIYDLLRTLPGVSVDESGNIIYRGASPSIYVNNSPSFILYPNIESIPVDLIEKIEVIDASMRKGGNGKGGIINIKLQRLEDGLSGVISLKTSTFKFKHFDQNNHLFNLNYKNGKSIWVNNFSYTSNLQNSGYEMGKIFNNPLNVLSIQNELNSTDNYDRGFSNCIGYVIELNPETKLTIGISLDDQYAFSKSRNYMMSKSKISNNFYSNLTSETTFGSKSRGSSFSANLWHQFDSTERFIESNLYLSLPDTKNNGNYIENYMVFEGQSSDSSYGRSYSSLTSGLYSFYADFFYNRPLTKNTRWNINYIVMGDLDQKVNDRFFHDNETIQLKNKEDFSNIVFNQVSLRIGTKFNKFKLDCGLNVEDKLIDGFYKRNIRARVDSTFKLNENFLKILPSIVLAYNLDDNNSLKFNLSKTARYPSFNELQGYIYTENSFLLFSGNPKLVPSDHYSAYAGYQKSKDNWNFSVDLFYSFANNLSTPVSIPVSTLIWMRKPYNIEKRITTGLDISFWVRIKKVNVSFYSSTYRTGYKSGNLVKELNGINLNESGKSLNYNLNSVITYKIKTYSFRGSMMVYGNQAEYDGYQNGWLTASINVTKTLFDEKCRVGIGAGNLLRNLSDNGYYSNSFDIITSSKLSGTWYEPYVNFSLRYDIKSGDRGTENIKGKR